jgi:hypothetical protein
VADDSVLTASVSVPSTPMLNDRFNIETQVGTDTSWGKE